MLPLSLQVITASPPRTTELPAPLRPAWAAETLSVVPVHSAVNVATVTFAWTVQAVGYQVAATLLLY